MYHIKFKTGLSKNIIFGRSYRINFIAVIIFLLGTISISYAQVEPSSTTQSASANYLIGAGDVLKVLVTKQELLSLDGVRVSIDGTIRLPMLNEDITAACLTEVELADLVANKYKKYILNPQVYIAVQEFHSNPVAFIGSVNAPGRFDVQRPTRLLELLTFVNGPATNAGKNIQIIRQANGVQCEELAKRPFPVDETDEILTFLLAETLKGSESSNPFLKSGDIVSIAAADEPEEAYIIGNVVKPTSIKLDEPITLSRAIAMAGGTSKDAKIDKIKVSRQDPKTLAKTEILINMKEVNLDNQKDILLQPNDIIDVPGPKPSILGKIFKSILPVVTRGIIPY